MAGRQPCFAIVARRLYIWRPRWSATVAAEAVAVARRARRIAFIGVTERETRQPEMTTELGPIPPPRCRSRHLVNLDEREAGVPALPGDLRRVAARGQRPEEGGVVARGVGPGERADRGGHGRDLGVSAPA